MACFSLQVDFTSCGGLLCIAAVLLMIIGIVTAIVLSFQYVRTLWSNALIYSLYSCFSVWGAAARKGMCVCVCDWGLSCVTQQVPWLHMLYAAIGAIVYTLVSLYWHEFKHFSFALWDCWVTTGIIIPIHQKSQTSEVERWKDRVQSLRILNIISSPSICVTVLKKSWRACH